MYIVLFLQALLAFTWLVKSNSFIVSSSKCQSWLMMNAVESKSEDAFFTSMEESFRSLGSKYEMNRVVDHWNQGKFKAVPLFGRLQKVTSQPTTIDVMTVNSFPELSLGPVLLLDDGAFVYKGESAPHPSASPNLYAVQSPFKIINPEFELVRESDKDSWIPTSGVCTIIGSNELSEDGKKLNILLERVELTLRDDGNNVYEFVAREFKNPVTGYHEVLLMTSELTAVKGNFGSLFLFFPVNA